MSTANLLITPSPSTLPTCNPNLMPFHIDYTGSAAVSAYMRIEKLQPEAAIAENAVEEVTDKGKLDPHTQGKGDTAVADADAETTTATTIVTTTDVVMADSTPVTPASEDVTIPASRVLSTSASEDTLVAESQASSPTATSSPTPLPALDDVDHRCISTFRGRAIHGLMMDLPEGYGGLLLKSTGKESMKAQKDDTKTKNKPKSTTKVKAKAKAKAEEKAAKSGGRVTRSAAAPKQASPIEIDSTTDDEEMADATVDTRHPSEDQPIRELIPTAQFSNFTLWHADRPVDKGRDEYARTLSEWISLAHEIHRSDL